MTASHVASMVNALRHRGPDDAGQVSMAGSPPGTYVALGASRLSLLDATRGGQPFRGQHGGALAYNGEIFNYRELRSDIRRAGYPLHTACDTEVLIAMLELHGIAALDRLDGMYSFAYFDGNRLVLARDPSGIKPLYFYAGPNWFGFASEVKALLRCPFVPLRIDAGTLFEGAVFGYSLDSSTYFDGIYQLRPGSMLEVKTMDGRLIYDESVYCSHPVEPDGESGWATHRNVEGGDAAETLLQEFVRSVDEHLLSDHQVGILLSGGVDSSTLLGAAAAAGATRLHTFTVGDDTDLPDARTARALALRLGHQHHEVVITPQEFVAAVPHSVCSQEAPVAPTGLEFLAAAARNHVKAALCGEGADEVFGGYWSHRDPLGLLRVTVQRYLTMYERMALDDPSCAARTKAVLQWLGQRDPAELEYRMWRFELEAQLVNSHLVPWDHGSMAHSLEVRLPYLSGRVRNLVGILPFGALRPLGSKALVRRICHRLLPPDIACLVTEQPKRGFPSNSQRLTRGLRDLAHRLVPQAHIENHPLRWLPPRSMPRLPGMPGGHATGTKGQASPAIQLPDVWMMPSPLSILLHDLFLVIFFVHRGAVPEKLSVTTLYDDAEFMAPLNDCLADIEVSIAASPSGVEGRRESDLIERALA